MARRRRALSDYQVKMLFLMPTLLLLVGMNVFPLIWSLYLSFHRYAADMPGRAPEAVGTANYTALLHDPNLWRYFQITAEFVVLAVGAQFLIGFGVALLLNREFKGKGLVTTLILLPMMLSPAVVGLFWKLIMDPNWGLLNFLIRPVTGAAPAWLTDARTALPSLVMIDTWMWSPFMMLICLAGLNAVPKYLYEAADVDRASGWFKFRHITLPLIGPLLLLALIFRTMDAFKLFDMVWVATAGGPGDVTEMVSVTLYRQAFQNWNTGEACALAYILLVVIIALSNLYIRWLNRVRGEA